MKQRRRKTRPTRRVGLPCWTYVRAVFRPKRTRDLAPGAEDFIGREAIFYVWGEYENGPYKGVQQLCIDSLAWPFAHAPVCDFKIREFLHPTPAIQMVRRQSKAEHSNLELLVERKREWSEQRDRIERQTLRLSAAQPLNIRLY